MGTGGVLALREIRALLLQAGAVTDSDAVLVVVRPNASVDTTGMTPAELRLYTVGFLDDLLRGQVMGGALLADVARLARLVANQA